MHNAIGAKLLQGKWGKSCIRMYMHVFVLQTLPFFDEYVNVSLYAMLKWWYDLFVAYISALIWWYMLLPWIRYVDMMIVTC